MICYRISANALKEYTGMYTISKSQRLRNTLYYIYLGNGDVLRIPPELLKDDTDFTQVSPLRFMYSEPKFGQSSAYTCVEISNENNNTCYLDRNDSLNEARASTYLGVIMAFLIMCLSVIPIFTILKKH